MIKALLFGTVIVVALAIGSVFFLMQQNSNLYVDFREAAETDNEVHVAGKIDHNRFAENNSADFSFYMIDKNGNERQVVLLNGKIDEFDRSNEVVVTGSMIGNEFIAKNILMKCVCHYKG